jgi:hypothetical protein
MHIDINALEDMKLAFSVGGVVSDEQSVRFGIREATTSPDQDGWRVYMVNGKKIQLVGDDLFVTNTKRLKMGIEKGCANSNPGQGQPDRHAHRDARRNQPWY